MAVSVTVKSVTRANASYYVNFTDGMSLEFANLDQLKQYGSEMDAPDNPPMARMLAVRYWLARDANASNSAIIAGKTLTFDLASANPIKVQ